MDTFTDIERHTWRVRKRRETLWIEISSNWSISNAGIYNKQPTEQISSRFCALFYWCRDRTKRQGGYGHGKTSNYSWGSRSPSRLKKPKAPGLLLRHFLRLNPAAFWDWIYAQGRLHLVTSPRWRNCGSQRLSCHLPDEADFLRKWYHTHGYRYL